ncbi:hypothetical protein, partial [Pseudomonas fluorescens]|uniref:hypothetical protein n=1 Tax=Pseudomonas fluorescens TaxID=294 RepID=UPI001CD80B10
AAPPLLTQKLPTLIVAVSHKHNRLPIPYRKGETVSCLSWGSFTVLLQFHLPRISVNLVPEPRRFFSAMGVELIF